MIANGNQYLGFEEIKTMICGIEGVYAENLLSSMTVSLKVNGKLEKLNLGTDKNFTYFKQQLKHFALKKE